MPWPTLPSSSCKQRARERETPHSTYHTHIQSGHHFGGQHNGEVAGSGTRKGKEAAVTEYIEDDNGQFRRWHILQTIHLFPEDTWNYCLSKETANAGFEAVAQQRHHLDRTLCLTHELFSTNAEYAFRYQFNTHLTNDQVVNNILVKALTTLPEPDFNLCLYLLNENMVGEEPVVRLVALQDLIEQARYADFWKLYEGDDIYKELTAEVLGFEDAIRASMFFNVVVSFSTAHAWTTKNALPRFGQDDFATIAKRPFLYAYIFCLDIANAVAMTFQSIESANLKAYLNLDGQKFSDFVKAQGWTEANGVVSIPVNKDNEAKTTVLTENIKFERKELTRPGKQIYDVV